MSTAHATITFHRADPDRESTILAALRVHGFRFEYIDAVTSPLRLFRAYGMRDADTLICDQLGTLVRKLDRSAVFTICQDPNNEFVGQLLVSDPDLGDFHCHADEEGTPLVPATEVRRAAETAHHAITAGVRAPAAFRQLYRLTGSPWWQRIDELRAGSAETTTTTTAGGSAA